MKVVATAKDVRITSRKARVVADSVVGLPVAEALALLSFTPRHAAREVAKVIKSAAANAEHNFNLEQSSLRVDRIDVDQAGIMKRYIAKPRRDGRQHLQADEPPALLRDRRGAGAGAPPPLGGGDDRPARARRPPSRRPPAAAAPPRSGAPRRPPPRRPRRPPQRSRGRRGRAGRLEPAVRARRGGEGGSTRPSRPDRGRRSEADGPGDEQPEVEPAQDDEEKD